jgi:NADH-quinone oxidoreductase subunit F
MIKSKRISSEDLVAQAGRIRAEKHLQEKGNRARVTVHMGTCGVRSGAGKVMDRLLALRSGSSRTDIAVAKTACFGLCSREPLVTVEVLGSEPIIYQNVDEGKMDRIFLEHVLGGRVQIDLALARGRRDDRNGGMTSEWEGVIPHLLKLPFFSIQKFWVLRNRGRIDPGRMEDYIEGGGYLAAARAWTEMSPGRVLEGIRGSGMRDRTGGGLPTGITWEFCAGSKSETRYVACYIGREDSLDLDLSLIEADPHSLLEGMIIAARAVSSRYGYIYVAPRVRDAARNLERALDQAQEAGFLGHRIFGSGFDFDVRLFCRDSAQLQGDEERAVTEWMEGLGSRTGLKPSLTLSGILARPTLLHDVETYAGAAHVVRLGSEAYAEEGTESSKGTKLFFLTGQIRDRGLIEIPMGTTLGQIVFDIGSGIPNEKKLKGLQIGGESGSYISPGYLNTPVDYDAMHRGFIPISPSRILVIDEDTCIVHDVWQHLRSCRDIDCQNCRPGCQEGEKLHDAFERICRGEGTDEDISLTEKAAGALMEDESCRLRATSARPILSSLRNFRDEYQIHVTQRTCPAVVCSALYRSPCQHACPLGIDVPAFLEGLVTSRAGEAFPVLMARNPFPCVCGRICPRPCETKCRRGRMDDAVAIAHLERFIGDHGDRNKCEIPPITRGEKAAIVGAGPSGLTAALELRMRGYAVTVYDQLQEPGGMLRSCIPGFRLERDALDREIGRILRTGIELRLTTRIGRDLDFESLESAYDVIYLAVGAQDSTRIGIPGEDASGVVGGVEFLRAVHSGKAPPGKHVSVIGGGDIAVDAARSAVRLGAGKVALYYHRERRDMTAQIREIENAESEGVTIIPLVEPLRVVTQYGKAVALELVQMRLDRFDGKGRRRPVPILGSEFRARSDCVVVAVGRKPDLGFLAGKSGIETNESRIVVDRDLHTARSKVWAGGEAVTGTGRVADAIEAGRLAAALMDRYLIHLRGTTGERTQGPARRTHHPEPSGRGRFEAPGRRVPMPERVADRPCRSFLELELGYAPEMAVAEARRCLRCDLKRER